MHWTGFRLSATPQNVVEYSTKGDGMEAKINDVVKAACLIGEDWHHSERGKCLGENVTIIGEVDNGYEVNAFLGGKLRAFIFAENEISHLWVEELEIVAKA